MADGGKLRGEEGGCVVPFDRNVDGYDGVQVAVPVQCRPGSMLDALRSVPGWFRRSRWLLAVARRANGLMAARAPACRVSCKRGVSWRMRRPVKCTSDLSLFFNLSDLPLLNFVSGQNKGC